MPGYATKLYVCSVNFLVFRYKDCEENNNNPKRRSKKVQKDMMHKSIR